MCKQCARECVSNVQKELQQNNIITKHYKLKELDMFTQQGKLYMRRYFSLLNMVVDGMRVADWSTWYAKHSIDVMPSALHVWSCVRKIHHTPRTDLLVPVHTPTPTHMYVRTYVRTCMHA